MKIWRGTLNRKIKSEVDQRYITIGTYRH